MAKINGANAEDAHIGGVTPLPLNPQPLSYLFAFSSLT
jgi:hypothetical protein